VSRRSERRKVEPVLPGSKHDPRFAPRAGDQWVAIEYACRFCNDTLWTFRRSTYPGADPRTWTRPRRGKYPQGWNDSGTVVHLPCAKCGTEPRIRKSEIDARLEQLAAHDTRKLRLSIA
jgi:hypothetical protein